MTNIKKAKRDNNLIEAVFNCEDCRNSVKLFAEKFDDLPEFIVCTHCGSGIRASSVVKLNKEDKTEEVKYIKLTAMSKQELEKMLESFAYDLVNFSLRAENGEIFVPKKGLKRLIKEYVTSTKVK